MASYLHACRYALGRQRRGEELLDAYIASDFEAIIRWARSGGSAFQDVPFSLPVTYKHLDEAFPNARFILTVRSSADLWYQSLIRHEAYYFGNGSVPTVSQLRESPYVHQGWLWKAHRYIYKIHAQQLYDYDIYTQHYLAYNHAVAQYFSERPGKLLILNLEDAGAPRILAQFLGLRAAPPSIPWENRSRQMGARPGLPSS